MTALGFAALSTANYLSSSNALDTGTFLRLWTATLLVLALGFLVILAGFLIASQGRLTRMAGGIMGVIASIAGAFLTIILVTTTAGVSSGNFGLASSLSFAIALEILYIGSFATLFTGFPLAMFGSMPAVVEKEPEHIVAE